MGIKKHIRIDCKQYPLVFDFFFGYKNKDKQLMISQIKGIKSSILHDIADLINNTDIEETAGWHMNCRGLFVMTMPVFNINEPAHYGTLQHEITHHVRECARFLGYPNSKDTDEFYCFLAGFLTTQVYKKLWA
jgi:hypothetical protein